MKLNCMIWNSWLSREMQLKLEVIPMEQDQILIWPNIKEAKEYLPSWNQETIP